ncbi:hypothetical protein ADICEAN_02239 [Cesiribacter andamanensis AMV16]|uniref:AraC-type arabinose-binding/dimerisation domain-containing protein n=1 Tax=Cesiribacter andamanensis AMV16 TaxID=1279009 RepID=M7NLH9_9BACT|nr:AraC family ligand binding domain-containing protein [Cesiribacter andamanensis]EMR02640.1 hypothetical protein ADICEAN_02239 [Cesiribacter andamanensis AMV16]
MRRYNFNRTKYGARLLIDLGRMESLPNYNLSREPHCITFYEILFITEGSGTFWLDGRPLAVAPRQVIFCAPYQSRQWQLGNSPLKGVSLFFEQEFMSGFFQDALFMQQLAYFNPLSERAALQLEADTYAKCLGLLQELEQELLSLQADSSHIFRSLLYYLLILLNRQFTAQQQGEQSQKATALQSFFAAAGDPYHPLAPGAGVCRPAAAEHRLPEPPGAGSLWRAGRCAHTQTAAAGGQTPVALFPPNQCRNWLRAGL